MQSYFLSFFGRSEGFPLRCHKGCLSAAVEGGQRAEPAEGRQDRADDAGNAHPRTAEADAAERQNQREQQAHRADTPRPRKAQMHAAHFHRRCRRAAQPKLPLPQADHREIERLQNEGNIQRLLTDEGMQTEADQKAKNKRRADAAKGETDRKRDEPIMPPKRWFHVLSVE